METHLYMKHLDRDGSDLLAAAATDPDASVSTCPGWSAADLLGHVGCVHRWVEETVRLRSVEFRPFPDAPHDFATRRVWYEEGLGRLLDALSAIGDEEQVWTLLNRGPGPARLWHRRMAQETAVHRWDAQHAVGPSRAIDTDLAVDGIDEWLTMVATRLPRSPVEDLDGHLGLGATDADVSCTLILAPDRLERRTGIHDAHAVVSGPTSDLYLWLLGRRSLSDGELSLRGDTAVAHAWTHVTFG